MAAPPTVLVTGASRGLGLEVCTALLRRGWHVVAGARRGWDDPSAARGAAALAAAAAAPARLTLLPLDVTRPDSIAAAVDAVRALGGLSALVNNAGMYQEQPWSRATWDATWATNVAGPVALTRAALGAPGALRDGGVVVNVASGFGHYHHLSEHYRGSITACGTLEGLLALPFKADDAQAGAFAGVYKVSKAALVRATALQAGALAAEGRRATVVAVSPGWCATDMGGPGAPRTPAQGGASILAALDAAAAAAVPSGAFMGEDGGVVQP